MANETGLSKTKDPNQWDSLSLGEKFIVKNNYQTTNKGTEYKYPDQRENSTTDELNFIDLSIYHPKYNNKYENHVPIDLPAWYCQFSGPEFPFVRDLWKFAVEQKMANVVGNLGKRAGNRKKSRISISLNFSQLNLHHL